MTSFNCRILYYNRYSPQLRLGLNDIRMERGGSMPADNPDGKKNKNKDRKVLLVLAIAALLFTLALNYFIGKRNSASVSEVK